MSPHTSARLAAATPATIATGKDPIGGVLSRPCHERISGRQPGGHHPEQVTR